MSIAETQRIEQPTPPAPARKKTVFRPDVQGLRAVAVLAVVTDHLLRWPSGGFVGVDVFFVISGYLITSLLLREHDRTGTISFRGFYARRVKRIIPASVLVTVSTLLTGWFLLDSVRFGQLVRDAAAAMFFVANWRFAVEGTDYFQEACRPRRCSTSGPSRSRSSTTSSGPGSCSGSCSPAFASSAGAGPPGAAPSASPSA